MSNVRNMLLSIAALTCVASSAFSQDSLITIPLSFFDSIALAALEQPFLKKELLLADSIISAQEQQLQSQQQVIALQSANLDSRQLQLVMLQQENRQLGSDLDLSLQRADELSQKNGQLRTQRTILGTLVVGTAIYLLWQR